MTDLGVADLVLIACRVLDLTTDAALDLLDVTAAEAALAEARTAANGDDARRWTRVERPRGATFSGRDR
jgi:hypothetical protein